MGNVALGLAHPCDPRAAFTTAFELAWVTDGYAKESAAIAAFVAAEGDPRAAIEHAVSYGRDCDSYATVAGAIAGAFAGAAALPEDWVAAVSAANEPPIDEVAGRLAGVVEGAVRRRAATAAAASSLLGPEPGG